MAQNIHSQVPEEQRQRLYMCLYVFFRLSSFASVTTVSNIYGIHECEMTSKKTTHQLTLDVLRKQLYRFTGARLDLLVCVIMKSIFHGCWAPSVARLYISPTLRIGMNFSSVDRTSSSVALSEQILYAIHRPPLGL